LFGAQVAYAFQNREAYLQEKLAENVNQRGREFVALRLLTCIGQRFQRGLPPATVPDMSKELGIPSRLVQQVLQTLLTARLVVEVSRGEPAYAPARPLEEISAHHVLLAMRATVGQELVAHDEPVRAEVYGEFARIQEAERQAASSVTMLALVNRVQARLAIAPPIEPEEIKVVPPVAVELEPARKPEPASAPEPERNVPATPPPVREPGLPEVPAPGFIVKTEKPGAPPNIAPTPPTAEATTAGEESFPL